MELLAFGGDIMACFLWNFLFFSGIYVSGAEFFLPGV
jgi:hypothetical protein